MSKAMRRKYHASKYRSIVHIRLKELRSGNGFEYELSREFAGAEPVRSEGENKADFEESCRYIIEILHGFFKEVPCKPTSKKGSFKIPSRTATAQLTSPESSEEDLQDSSESTPSSSESSPSSEKTLSPTNPIGRAFRGLRSPSSPMLGRVSRTSVTREPSDE